MRARRISVDVETAAVPLQRRPVFFSQQQHIYYFLQSKESSISKYLSHSGVSCSSIVFFWHRSFSLPSIYILHFPFFFLTRVQSWCVCLCALPRRIFSHCRLHHISFAAARPAVAAEGELYCGKVTRRPSCDPPPPLQPFLGIYRREREIATRYNYTKRLSQGAVTLSFRVDSSRKHY